MSRTLRERWTEEPWKQTGEAIGHVVVGAATVCIMAGFRAWGFPLWEVPAGACAMVPWVILREGIDQWPIESWADTVVDSLEFIVAGALGGFALWAAG